MNKDNSDRYHRLFNTVQCGIFEYRISDGQIFFEDINPAGLKMFGYTREEFEKKTLWTNEELVYPEDIPVVVGILRKIKKVGDEEEFTYRMSRKDGSFIWVTGNLRIVKIDGTSVTYQSECLNIDKLKKTEHELAMEQEKMEIALANSEITIWDYDLTTRACIRSDKQKNLFGTPQSVTAEDLIATERIHPDSIQECRGLFKAIDNGQLFAQAVVRLKREENEYRHVRMSIKRKPNETMAVGWTEDISQMIEDQNRLRDELERQESASANNLVAKARFNLTTNIVENYIADETISVGKTGENYDDWCESLLETVCVEEQRKKLYHSMNRKTAVENFEYGEREHTVEYQRRKSDGSQIWARTTTRIYKNAKTGNLMMFLYTTDITNEVILKEVITRVDRSESELMSVIYPETDRMYIFHSKTTEAVNQDLIYSESVERFAEEMVLPEYREDTRKALSVEMIRHQLESCENYRISLPVQIGDKACRKNWSFYYLDDARSTIVMNRSDISELFEQQIKQREALESALLVAKQASSAKSNFLSRMSHEIRTPMNAILGMCTLAAQAMGNDEEIADCISKIGISGHYLLSLINDILDMSRIESGKMLLHNDKFRMDEFISGINAVIYGQTRDKKIDYETRIDSNLEEVYLGDAMKLQQIIVNILGNAVKFTGEGGKITFAVHAGTVKNNVQKILFTVNDTGCGIGEESLERIFEPFEQEDSSITSEYGGTGLGLAICKNLVELMGGSIQCRSIVGVGSEFTVSLPLEVVVGAIPCCKKEYTFDKMHTLIVDDDIVICESTAKTLEDIGMIPEWVCSGMEAVERVNQMMKQNRSYEFILIDWKMPEMDGIETARRIRQIVGPDVTIIIITAYDWVSIEREAKMAGVNMCISKPMFKSTLVSAFQKAQSEKEESEEVKKIEYDFTGIRILLAEDHPMNAEIARKLLEHKNCEVEIAENGLRALELFTTKPVGYYQAILMDVRMPIMDGIQAASNIRRWNKEDAKKIPIIAMTANAFDEDVEKCQAAGMNAHLSKPIEPELMYHTIQKFTGGTE